MHASTTDETDFTIIKLINHLVEERDTQHLQIHTLYSIVMKDSRVELENFSFWSEAPCFGSHSNTP